MDNKSLSPSEIYVLSLIYELGQADIYEILERASSEKKWAYTTVLTMVSRMFEKGYLTKNKQGKRFIYLPKFSKNESFRIILDRFFGTTLLDDPSPIIEYLTLSKKLKKAKKMLTGITLKK